MLIRLLRSFLLLAFWCAPAGFGQPPATRLNPTVKEIVAAVSEERIGATMKRLEGFGTRYILSEQDSPTHGIGAAQRWILDEFKSYSPRLQVKLDPFTASVPYTARVARMNAAVLASLALAPKPPVVLRPRAGVRPQSGQGTAENSPGDSAPAGASQDVDRNAQGLASRPSGPGLSRGKRATMPLYGGRCQRLSLTLRATRL